MYSDLPKRGAPARISNRAANALYLLAIAGLFATGFLDLLLLAALRALFPGIGADAQRLLTFAVYYLGFLLIPTALVLKKRGAWESARLRPIGGLQMAAIVPVALLGVVVSLNLGALWAVLLDSLGIPLPQGDSLVLSDSTGGLSAAVLAVGMLPGVCEELLFRGAILGSYEGRGTKKAIALSAVLFALMHGTPAGLPTQLMLGAVMGYLAFACDSIYAAIAYHTVHNVALLFASVLYARAPEAAVSGQGTRLFEAVGGAAGLWMIGVQLAIFAGLLFAALRAFDRRRRARGIALVPPARERMSNGARWMLAAALLLAAALYALSFV